jgi:MYXO-CTERM domain-containing protein
MLPILLLLASIDPGRPIAADVPWAVAPDDGPRSYFEAVTGRRRIDVKTIEPVREGDMVFDHESMAVDLLAEMGAPLPSVDHPPTPGILILALNGVTLKGTCPGGQTANGALNCSPLVDGEVTFPAAGSDQQNSAIFQEIKGFYEDFDLIISTSRPPDYLPYTLAVIGGTSTNAGYENGVCGIANVACDGAKRNHVSLSFSGSCPGDAALTAGQETAHNWGLEHTDVEQDIMYPFVVGAGSFLDMCMPISHATGSGTTQCSYVHESVCPDGQGEQQNSYGELMGVFGPRTEDTTKPTIVSIAPETGSTFSTTDTIQVTAKIADDSNFLGVKWTWLEGLPPTFEDKGYTRCTNDVCTDDFPAWKPIEDPWDMIALKNPPAGHYAFKLEVIDAYANSVSQTIEFDVVKEGEAGSAEATGDPGTDGSDSATPTEGGDSDTPTGGGPTTFTSLSDGMTDPGEDNEGCGCRTPAAGAPLFGLVLVGLGLRRRRR